jgi:hypothetical protein
MNDHAASDNSYDPFGFEEKVVKDDRPLEVTLEDFRAYMKKQGACIFMPSGEIWPGANVSKRVPPVFVGFDGKGKPKYISAATWLFENKGVEQMTWSPGEPQLIRDRLFVEAGCLDWPRATVFNLYRSPTTKHGDPEKAQRWVNHVEYIYPDDAERIIAFFAHAVQKPHEKVNHAILLGGLPGIGKDSLLAPVRMAVGPWNFAEVTPKKMLAAGKFNGYLRSVILRISEAHDLGDTHRTTFYESLKDITASPPEALRIDEKNVPEFYVVNVCHVVVTTNHRIDAIYLPAEDRRFDVCWSPRTETDFGESSEARADYWRELWRFYYQEGGFRHVAGHLAALDISDFDPKAPPPKTEAFWTIVGASRAPEDAELADVIDALADGRKDANGNLARPIAFTLAAVLAKATELAPKDDDGKPERNSFAYWLADRKNRSRIPHRFEQCSYTPVRNDAAKDGLWKVNGARQVVYALDRRSLHERLRSAKQVVDRKGETCLDPDLFGRSVSDGQ